MTPAIRAAFGRLERQKNTVTAELSSWPAERLGFHPSSSAWSALEVLDHVVRVERAFLKSAETARSAAHASGLRELFRAWIVIGVMSSPLRVKVPRSAPGALPKGDLSFGEIGDQWQRTRDEIERVLESSTPAQYRVGVFRHPVSGWMTLPQALAFLSAHLRHHRYQLARIARAARHPSRRP